MMIKLYRQKDCCLNYLVVRNTILNVHPQSFHKSCDKWQTKDFLVRSMLLVLCQNFYCIAQKALQCLSSFFSSLSPCQCFWVDLQKIFIDQMFEMSTKMF